MVDASDDHLKPGIWLMRALWLVTLVLTVATAVVRIPYNYQATFQDLLVSSAARLSGLSWVQFTQYMIMVRYASASVFVLVGTILFAIRSRSGFAILVSIALMSMPLIFAGFGVDPGSYRLERQGVPQGLIPLLDILSGIAMISVLLTAFLFPDGRYAPRWLRWTPVAWLLMVIGYLIDQWLVAVVVLLALLIGALYGQIYRYIRVSDATQKQQTRLVLAGILIQPLLLLLTPVARDMDNAPFSLFVLHMQVLIPLLIPITFALSILRYRLWDIDLIIRRTLVYTVVVIVVGLVYFGSVTLLQTLFTSVTGAGSPLALVISTLGIAALFAPIRRRISDAVDRRFYRQKYNAQQTIEGFNDAIRQEYDMDSVIGELVAVVSSTMQPEHVSIWMASTAQIRAASTAEDS